ncbi:MAG TPA: CoA transferase, partial [Acidimicrobiales bacterium]
LDAHVAGWIAERTEAEVLAAFEAAEAAIAPVLTMADIATDPHYKARGTIASVSGTPMQALVARLSATPGALRHAGGPIDADGDAIRRDGWG